MTGLIAFDGAILAAGPPTGVARAFLVALAAYVPLADGKVAVLLPPGGDGSELPTSVEVVPAPRGALQRQLTLPRLLRKLGALVLHSPVAAIPLRARCARIATVHDLPWCAPGLGERGSLRARFAVRQAVLRADAVLVPSRFTLQCLQRWLGPRGTERAQIVPHGVPQPERPAPKENLRGPFLVLGDDRPRKNHARVKAAHAIARQRSPALPDLQFVGPPDHWVSEAEKTRLLRRCRALVHASLFEGFGLPVVEAMAHGVPVICSLAASLPEVGGGAAVLVDPRDVEALARAMVHVHENQELRDALRAAGLAHSVDFAPQRTARAWLELHRELLAGKA